MSSLRTTHPVALGLVVAALALAPRTAGAGADPTYQNNFHNDYATRQVTPRVIFYGDSITDFFGEAPFGSYNKLNDGNPGYNATLQSNSQAVWQNRIARFRAFNFGVSGSVVSDLYGRIANHELDAPRRPKVVVLMIGINNLGLGDTPQSVADQIISLMDLIHAEAPGVRILLMGVLPVSSKYAHAPKVAPLNALLAQQVTPFGARAARGYGSGDYFLDIGSYFFTPNGQFNDSLFLSDGAHPNYLGYGVWAAAINAPLRLMLREVPVPNDFDGDGKSDVTVFQRSTGIWYSNLSAAGYTTFSFGLNMIPAPADYDGDGLTDLAVFDRANMTYYITYSNTTTPSAPKAVNFPWGNPNMIPVPADYDGDGKADIAGFDASALVYYVAYSGGGSLAFSWGGPGMIPVPADYDGDGKADIAGVWQPYMTYYIIYTSNGTGVSFPWGNTTIIPAPEDNDGDGTDDIAGFDPATATYYINRSSGTSAYFPWGDANFVPVPGDYDGDALADFGIYDKTDSNWATWDTTWGIPPVFQFGGGGPDIVPVNAPPTTRYWLSR